MNLKTLLTSTALVAFAASAQAATVTLQLIDAGTDGIFGTVDDVSFVVEDDDANDNVAGLGNLNYSGAIGDFTLTINTVITTDENNLSTLTLNASAIGAGKLAIGASGVGFTAGVADPTFAWADSNASLNPGTVTYDSCIDTDNEALTSLTFDCSEAVIYSPPVTTGGTENAQASIPVSLFGPFSITSAVVIDTSGLSAASATAFDASVSVQPVPLPAAGLMLAGGLGGLVALRRRKKKA